VPGSDDIGAHLVTSLMSAAALLLGYFCLTLYLIGTRRLVRRSRSGGSGLEAQYRAVTRKILIACCIGAVPLIGLFATGLPTYIGRWEPGAHHMLFFVALVCQLIAQGWLFGLIGRGERLLGEVAIAEYNEGAP
ncbi:MAG: hypothetical protein K8J08_17795, partial [Thermoanaerobaculia bacterium]|nr:hypothetical protein [Thermoanaerobaculia bacterium]